MKKTFALLATSLFATFAGAAVMSSPLIEQTASIVAEETPWTYSVDFNRFDGRLGNLTAVSFVLNGHVLGTFSGENRGTQPVTLKNLLNGSMRFALPNGAVEFVFEDAKNMDVGQFDGKADFGGTSGYDGETLERHLDKVVNDTNLAFFLGSSPFSIDISADNASSVFGPSNIDSMVLAESSASLTLRYDYTVASQAPAPVPEPASLALVGLALAGVAASRRRGN